MKSHWLKGSKVPRFPRLDKDLQVDVVIVGGGVTGVTAAYLLKKAGRTVALLERDRCCGGDTAHTTAHLTFVTDLRLHELVDRFGRDHAQAAWDAGRAAMNQIHNNVQNEDLDCEFAWVPGYLHNPKGEAKSQGVKELEETPSSQRRWDSTPNISRQFRFSRPRESASRTRQGSSRSNTLPACSIGFRERKAMSSKEPR